MSEAEFALLEERARGAGVRLAEWVREALLAAPVEPVASSGADSGEVALGEILALRSLILNLHFRAAKGEPVAESEMRGLIERADGTKIERAMMEGFVERLYAYTGDRHEMQLLEQFFDYELAHGLTPVEGYAWAGVPYPSGDPGAAEYRGWSAHGVDFVEPHVVGEDGYAYLRLWEMTGEERYLKEAIRCARAASPNPNQSNATALI